MGRIASLSGRSCVDLPGGFMLSFVRSFGVRMSTELRRSFRVSAPLKPLVAVVGRPNVGKSTLFNRLVGRRIAIVEDTPGITRDRLYADGDWRGREYTLVDTGGIQMFEQDPLKAQI